jgi:hypothetical protein
MSSDYVGLYIDLVRNAVIHGTPVNPRMLEVVQQAADSGNPRAHTLMAWMSNMRGGSGPEGQIAGEAYAVNHNFKGPLGNQGDFPALGVVTPDVAPTGPAAGYGQQAQGPWGTLLAQNNANQRATNSPGQTSDQSNPHEVYGNTSSILANTANDAEMQASIAGIKARADQQTNPFNPNQPMGPVQPQQPGQPAFSPAYTEHSNGFDPNVPTPSTTDPSSNAQNNLNYPPPSYMEGMPGVPAGYAGSPGQGAGSQDLGMTGMLAGDPNGWLAKAGVTTQFLNNYNNYGDPMYLDMYAKQQGLPEWWARQNADQFANMGSLYELQHGSPVDDPANLVNMASDLGPGGSLNQPGQYMSGTALYDNGLMQGNVAGLNAGEQLSSLTPPEQAAVIKQSVGTIAQYLTADAGAGLTRQMDRAITDWQELGAQSGGIPPVDLLTYLHSIGADNWIG